MTMLGDVLRQNPELALFLALALGFLAGRLRLGHFSLGPVLGTLLAAVIIGQSGVALAPAVRVFLFELFLFATGYKVGPQFFRGLKKDALPQVILTLVICVASLPTSVGLARLLGYDVGTAVGLLAGAFSESTVIGTASEAIQRLGLPPAETARLVNNIPVAYAVTCLVGTTAVVWFLSWAAPRLLRVDLPAASRALESALTGRVEVAGVASAYQAWDVRAIRLEGTGPAGRTVATLEQALPGHRLLVERLRRRGAISEPGPGEVLAAGDVVAVRARREAFLGPLAALGPEVTDPELLDFPVATMDVVVTRREVAGQTLEAVATLHGRGLVLRMEPVVLLGACAGAGTTTAGLKAIQDAARSRIPVLGYTVPYAVGNILLTAWGPVIVALMR